MDKNINDPQAEPLPNPPDDLPTSLTAAQLQVLRDSIDKAERPNMAWRYVPNFLKRVFVKGR